MDQHYAFRNTLDHDVSAQHANNNSLRTPEKKQFKKRVMASDSAHITAMVIETSSFLNRIEANQYSLFTQKFHNSVAKTILKFEGTIVKQDNNSYQVIFKSVTNAIICALKIHSNFKYITPKFDLPNRRIKIGLDTGMPITNKPGNFEDAFTLATRMCELVNHQIVISSEVKSHYEAENRNAFINKESIRTLKLEEEVLLNRLMDVVENYWYKSDFNVTDLSKKMELTTSQLYRKIKKLTGKTPNHFIKEYRLHRALQLLHEQKGLISEIALKSGFKSPDYFSKCFFNNYGILPSKYIQQHVK